jgi:hypothetical protein
MFGWWRGKNHENLRGCGAAKRSNWKKMKRIENWGKTRAKNKLYLIQLLDTSIVHDLYLYWQHDITL